jgi:hypothetical protein
VQDRRRAENTGSFSHQEARRSKGSDAVKWSSSLSRWTLKADDGAGRRFRGSDCGLCTDGEWTVRRRLLDRVGAGAR